MSTRERLLRGYIANVLERKDDLIEFLYLDNKEKFSGMDRDIAQKMKFTPGNLKRYLQIIAEHMIDGGYSGKKIYHTAVLLIYSIKIDDFLKKTKMKDYKTDVLTDALVSILMRINFEIPKKSRCTIRPLMFISFSFLVCYCCYYRYL